MLVLQLSHSRASYVTTQATDPARYVGITVEGPSIMLSLSIFDICDCQSLVHLHSFLCSFVRVWRYKAVCLLFVVSPFTMDPSFSHAELEQSVRSWYVLLFSVAKDIANATTGGSSFLFRLPPQVCGHQLFLTRRLRSLPAWFVYDYLLTLPDEIRCIWQRQISSVTVIFLGMRYAALLNLLNTVRNFVPWNKLLDGGEAACAFISYRVEILCSCN